MNNKRATFYKRLNRLTQNSLMLVTDEGCDELIEFNDGLDRAESASACSESLYLENGIIGEETFNKSDSVDQETTNTDETNISQNFPVVVGGSSKDSCASFKSELKNWALRNQISHKAINELLKLMKESLPIDLGLSTDARTLLGTPRNVVTRKVEPGVYSHRGLQSAVEELCRKNRVIPEKIELLVSVDGLPISKSSGSQLYPVLCSFYGYSGNVAVIGIYHGNEKPGSANEFLEEFITEAVAFVNNGVEINNIRIPFLLKAFICDAPAKSFVRYTKGHTGFFSCTKCMQKGEYLKGRTCFAKCNGKKRTDLNFLTKQQPAHHVGTSSLEKVPQFGMVSGFPLEYMHLLCLGVTKKLIVNLWLFGKAPNRLAPNIVETMSNFYVTLEKSIPSEFSRKPRSLNEVKRWKATEFRLFLVYTGPVVLKQYLSNEKYKHFLTLFVATRVFLDSSLNEYNDFAHSLMVYFVKTFSRIYGPEFVSHNVHGLTHISEDVKLYGSLDSYSAFQFENFMQVLKKLIRKHSAPLPQIMKRLEELEGFCCKTGDDKPFTLKHEHCTGPISDCLDKRGNNQFKVAKFKSFILDVDHEKNRFCSLSDNSIVVIFNFVATEEENLLIGKKFRKKRRLFSRSLSIFTTWDLQC